MLSSTRASLRSTRARFDLAGRHQTRMRLPSARNIASPGCYDGRVRGAWLAIAMGLSACGGSGSVVPTSDAAASPDGTVPDGGGTETGSADASSEQATEASGPDAPLDAAPKCPPFTSKPVDPSWCLGQSMCPLSFNAIGGSAPNDVWAVGAHGLLAHFDGHTWFQVPSGDAADASLMAVWASGPCDAWASGLGSQANGAKSAVFHWDGATWSNVPIPGALGSVLTIWGSGPADVYFGAATLLHFDGKSVTDTGQPGAYQLWGSSVHDVWALSVTNGITHFDGSTWTTPSLPGPVPQVMLKSMSGTGPSDVWVVGAAPGEAAGGNVWHWSGTSFQQSCNPLGEPYGVFTASAGDVWMWGGVTVHVDASCNPLADPSPPSPNVMWGSSANDVWSVNGGAPSHWDGTSWRTGGACGAADAGADAEAGGAPSNLMFETGGASGGNWGGLAGADTQCQQAASSLGYPGHYAAWLSTSTIDAISRLGAARGWRRPDGQPFADTASSIANNLIFYPPSGGGAVWTGTKADGTRSQDTCQDWTSNAATDLGHTGDGSGGAWNWTDVGSVACNNIASLYCFGIDYTTPVDAPSPAGPTRLAFLSSSTFDPSTGITGADALCAAEASAHGFTGTFEAVLGTTTDSPDGRFSACGWPWARPDNVVAIQSYDSLRTGMPSWSAPIDQTADGSYLSVPVFVGAPPNQIGGPDCANWSSSASNALMGASGQADRAMPNAYTTPSPCSTPGHVYCLQQ